jgi:protein-disulfide isomerase
MMSHQTRIRAILDVVAAVCVTLASIAVIWNIVTARSSGVAIESTQGRAAEVVKDVAGLRLQTSLRFVHGVTDATAHVAVLEVTDFECPFCRRHARESYPKIKRDFVDTGRVVYALMNLPLEALHRNAADAARAASCAGRQAKFWEMHDWLFKDAANVTLENIRAHAHELPLDTRAFEQCLAEGTAELRQEMEEARRLGVGSTPTFLLGQISGDGVISVRRRIDGAVSYSVIKAAIDELVASLSAGR